MNENEFVSTKRMVAAGRLLIESGELVKMDVKLCPKWIQNLRAKNHTPVIDGFLPFFMGGRQCDLCGKWQPLNNLYTNPFLPNARFCKDAINCGDRAYIDMFPVSSRLLEEVEA